MQTTEEDTQVRTTRVDRGCAGTGYCNDVRGYMVLDSAKKVLMTLRAAGRSVQRFTRVDR